MRSSEHVEMTPRPPADTSAPALPAATPADAPPAHPPTRGTLPDDLPPPISLDAARDARMVPLTVAYAVWSYYADLRTAELTRLRAAWRPVSHRAALVMRREGVEIWLPRPASAPANRPPPRPALTLEVARIAHRDIVRLIGLGLSQRRIAATTGKSRTTIKVVMTLLKESQTAAH
jgi:hypothetical protein